VQAEDLTRCTQYLYSLSINPDPRQGRLSRDQYMDYIARTEDMLGLTGQPRAVVFHEKYGREHCHVVWSRIDAMQGKAVHLAFDHDKLMRVTRAFARDHGLKLPPGYEKSREVGQESLYEREKKRQTGLSKEDHMRAITHAWQHSDSARAFVHSLSEQGYLLATGKRPYVLVDLYGGTHALARLIDDKAVRTADLRAFLDKDFPPESLPSVEEAVALAERHRAAIDKDVSDDERATALQSLKAEQAARRQELLQDRQLLDAGQQGEASRVTGQHRDARVALRRGYLGQRRRIHQQRHENRPTGLAAFLGRVTGVEALRALLHRRQDALRFKDYRDQLAALLAAQKQERHHLAQRHQAEAMEQVRREKALTRVDRREIVALLRDLRAAQRVLNRSDSEGRMPSLAVVAPKARRATVPPLAYAPVHRPGELRTTFDAAATRSPNELPDVLAAFARAAQKQRGERERSDDKAPALDRMARRPVERDTTTPTLDRGPEPGRERD